MQKAATLAASDIKNEVEMFMNSPPFCRQIGEQQQTHISIFGNNLQYTIDFF